VLSSCQFLLAFFIPLEQARLFLEVQLAFLMKKIYQLMITLVLKINDFSISLVEVLAERISEFVVVWAN